MNSAAASYLKRPIPLSIIFFCTLAFHGPLLLMKLPAHSFDANFHMSMASHYAQHWFDPWNKKALAGFSETTYPPLTHQWIAIFSHVVGLDYGFMIVQGIAIFLLPFAVYRFAKLWTDERAASYAALLSIFTGSLALLVYQDGQIGTTAATTLFLLAIPYLYQYIVWGKKQDLWLGVCICCTAAAAHHATLLFGMVFFIPPTLWIAVRDYRESHPEVSITKPVQRMGIFAGLSLAGMALVLLPYILIMMKNPINQVPIPHMSRSNFLLHPIWGLHYWLMPFSFVVLALPYIFYKGAERRLRPLLLGFYFALLFGLGGTTPLPRLLLGRAYEILTFERFTFWAVLLALPFVGMLAATLIDRFQMKAVAGIAVLAIGCGALAAAWNTYFPLLAAPIDVRPVVNFLNQGDHAKYRYMTLGFGNALSRVMCYSNAPSVDGEYNSGRTLPEMTKYGAGQLSSAKFYGSQGMESLAAMLKHADHYGLRYIFVHDAYYEPMLTFAGWRKIEDYNDGEVTVWTTIGIRAAYDIPSPLRPPLWQGIMWGTLPVGVSLLTIALAFMRWQKRKAFTDETQTDALAAGFPDCIDNLAHSPGPTVTPAA